jgi:uncharacterized protein YndB with AHSA1/START domain
MSASTPAMAPQAGDFEYVSHWQLTAPVEAVWRALIKTEHWPSWWRYVKRVQSLRPGEADGLGAVDRITWTSRLPYGFTFDVEVVESRPCERLRGVARGQLEGVGLWELTEDRSGATRVRYTWQLDLNTRWMRLTAPLMAPVFRWNHEGVMHAGAQGVARHLGARLLEG